MKRKILILGILLIAFISYNFKKDAGSYRHNTPFAKNAGGAGHPEDVQMTLNGITEDNVKTMMADFYTNKYKDRQPTKLNVWFDITTIQNMVNVLEGEIAWQQKNNIPQGNLRSTDGIRIYFISAHDMVKGHLQNSVALISTKYFGQSADGKDQHYDYYTHNKDEPLFKEDPSQLKGLAQEKQLGKLVSTTSLYSIANFPARVFNDKKDCNDNLHTIPQGLANKMVNRFGGNSISTISEWFDLGFFEALLDDVTKDKIDGIRIYFGTHPPKYKGVVDADYYKEAFIIEPTTLSNDGKTHKDNYNVCLPKVPSGARGKHLSIHNALSGEGYDKGELCPENCTVDSSGDGGKLNMNIRK